MSESKSESNCLCISDFLAQTLRPGGPTVEAAVGDLRDRLKDREFSDVVDDEGHQYVDLVLQGGGVLGVALVGYVYALEQVGIRFLGIAGASAGAINALLIAALGFPSQAKSEKLLERLTLLNAVDFLDGDWAAKSLSAAYLRGEGALSIAPRIILSIRRLFSNFGLHPGQKFETWLDDVLEDEKVETYAELKARMSVRPNGLRLRWEPNDEEANRFNSRFPGRLAIVAVDASTQTKFVFPEMAELITDDADDALLSTFVRASMSIPYVFEPKRMECGRSTDDRMRRWKEYGYEAELPKDHLFVDGGVVSNFPIGIFHATEVVPFAPTFGVRLGVERQASDVSSVGKFSMAWIDSARQALDLDFLSNNPDYKHLIGTIDVKGFNWLDFNLDREQKLQLFARGVEAAIDFLAGPSSGDDGSNQRKGFDWQAYKALREKLAEAALKSRAMRHPGSVPVNPPLGALPNTSKQSPPNPSPHDGRRTGERAERSSAT